MSDRAGRARSFERAAGDYDRYRPEYPRAALEWVRERLDLRDGCRVLDLGAGTGKLTRGLLELGLEPVAVEPGAAMLAHLRSALPRVEAHQGSAEAIPLPDGSVEGAVVGQAYHWFDPAGAPRELHRVLRPGRGLALLWNWWDARDPLQRRIREIVPFADTPVSAPLPGAPWFEELDRVVVESVAEQTPAGIVGRLATTSALLVAPEVERRELLAAVEQAAREAGSRFPFPQLTYALAFRRLS